MPESGVPPPVIVEALDVLEENGSRRRTGGPAVVVKKLYLQRGHKALG